MSILIKTDIPVHSRQVGDSVHKRGYSHLNVTSVAGDVGVCVSRPTTTIRTTMDAHASNMPHLFNVCYFHASSIFIHACSRCDSNPSPFSVSVPTQKPPVRSMSPIAPTTITIIVCGSGVNSTNKLLKYNEKAVFLSEINVAVHGSQSPHLVKILITWIQAVCQLLASTTGRSI